ncbi:MAG: VCBS repeat-containing protein [Planctomycetes bacterium]|nr:VCBS repeat-containing protein [Planctomycetota bacterium]
MTLHVLRACVTACAFVAAFSIEPRAQVQVWENVGVPLDVRLGFRTCVVGDIDSDGVADVLHTVEARTGPDANQLRWYSGATGKLIRVVPPLGQRQQGAYWQSLSPAGDHNGDGYPDFVAYAYSGYTFGTRVVVVSGKDDSFLWWVSPKDPRDTKGFGESLLGNVDLDGDKRPDVVVIETLTQPEPTVTAYRNDGSVLWSVTGDATFAPGAFRVDEQIDSMGDIDNDGCDDLVIGGGKPGVGGGAVLVSGKTGKFLLSVGDPRNRDNLGATVEGMGDIDGDGYKDFAAGGGAVFSTGVVYAFSGKDGHVIHEWRPDRPMTFSSDFSTHMESGFDADLDGVQDLAIGSRGHSEITIRSGRTGDLLYRLGPTRLDEHFGSVFAVMPADTSSRSPSLIEANFNHSYWAIGKDSGPRGRLARTLLVPPHVRTLDHPCKGSLTEAPVLGVSEVRDLGLRVGVAHTAPGSVAILCLGTSTSAWLGRTLPHSLDAVGARGCRLLTSIEHADAILTGGVGANAGYGSLVVPLRAPALLDVEIHAQWIVLDGSLRPGAASNGLSFRLRPPLAQQVYHIPPGG